MKHCPKCKREWPDTGKFCPMDGTPLEDLEEDEEQEDLSTQVMDEDEEKAEAAGDAPAPAPVEAAEGDVPFSETKWFMAGETVKDKEVEAEDRPLDDLQDVYKKTRQLPPDVRKKFSLKYGTKDDDKDSGKKKG